MGGSPIFESPQEVHKRGKSKIKKNNRKSTSTEVSKGVLLVNAVIFTVMNTLREDPLSTGISDMFFFLGKIRFVSSTRREF